jgi:hypothetical protein
MEGKLIYKRLNSSMLRILENCDKTLIFIALFELLNKYNKDQIN